MLAQGGAGARHCLAGRPVHLSHVLEVPGHLLPIRRGHGSPGVQRPWPGLWLQAPCPATARCVSHGLGLERGQGASHPDTRLCSLVSVLTLQAPGSPKCLGWCPWWGVCGCGHTTGHFSEVSIQTYCVLWTLEATPTDHAQWAQSDLTAQVSPLEVILPISEVRSPSPLRPQGTHWACGQVVGSTGAGCFWLGGHKGAERPAP